MSVSFTRNLSGCSLLYVYMLKKKVKMATLILAVIVIAMLGAAIGLFKA